MQRFQPVQPPTLERGLLHVGYQYAEYAPAPHLQEWVCCYWSSAVHPQQNYQLHRIIPDGCIDIIFDLDASDHYGAFLSSLMCSYEVMEITESMAFFGIRFYASEIRRLLGDASASLSGMQVTLEQWLGDRAASITEQIITAPTMHERIDLVDRWLYNLACDRDDSNTVRLRQMIQYIQAGQGRMSIRELSEQTHYSDRTLRRLFRQELGISPKEWSDIMRFQAVLKYGQLTAMNSSLCSSAFSSSTVGIATPEMTLGEIALHFGYYDQSHLNLAFSRYYGVSPGQLFQR